MTVSHDLGSPFSSKRLYSCPSSLGPLPAWKRNIEKLITYLLLLATFPISVVCEVARNRASMDVVKEVDELLTTTDQCSLILATLTRDI